MLSGTSKGCLSKIEKKLSNGVTLCTGIILPQLQTIEYVSTSGSNSFKILNKTKNKEEAKTNKQTIQKEVY